MTLAAELAPYLRQRRGISAATVWYRVRLVLFGVACAAVVVAVVAMMYRVVQHGPDDWSLERARQVPDDGENGGIEWELVARPVRVVANLGSDTHAALLQKISEMVPKERYDRLREIAGRAVRGLETAGAGGASGFAIARAVTLHKELAALDAETRRGGGEVE